MLFVGYVPAYVVEGEPALALRRQCRLCSTASEKILRRLYSTAPTRLPDGPHCHDDEQKERAVTEGTLEP